MTVWKNDARRISTVIAKVLAAGLVIVVLFTICGCGVDTTTLLSGLLNPSTASTSSSVSDLTGTWSGILSANNQSQNYVFVVDSSGNLIADNATVGTATISSGTVTFTYATSDNYTIKVQGTLDSDKTRITISAYSWSGASGGSSVLSGTLTKSGSTSTSTSTSVSYLLTDLVGTWSGAMTENGQVQNYKFTVDSSGGFTTSGGLSGIATISTTGAVTFTYTSGGYTGTFQGIINSAKTEIAMTLHTWSGTSSGSAAFTGTLSKGT